MKQILLYVLILSNVFAYSQERGVSIATQQATPTVQGDVYALVVGISNYPYIKPLNYADNDAELFANYLRSNSGGKIKEENLVLLTNDKAKSGNFWANFMKLSSKVKSGDRYYIYFAGHGDASKEMNEYFLLLQDCQPAGDANNYLAGSSTIQIYNLKNRIGILTKKGVEVVLILDACRSNELVGGYSSQAFNQNIAESKVGEILMLATGQGQVSIESQNLADGHGLFTYTLIDGLSGAADKEDGNNDGKVSMAELQDWVKRKVRNTAEQKFKTKQTPFFCCSEKENTILALTDSNFNKQWETVKTMGSAGNNAMAINTPKSKRSNVGNDDTAVITLYNKFSNAIKLNLLWGDSSANYYYDILNKKYPNTSTTEDAGILYSAEGINLVQTKINLFLKEGDAATNDPKSIDLKEYNSTGLLNKVIRKNFVASKLDWTNASKIYSKSLEILKPYDSSYVKSLIPFDYILKARSYLDKTDTSSTIEQSLNYAKQSYQLDSKSIITIQTILWIYYTTKQYDSAFVYAQMLQQISSKSFYGNTLIGNIYNEQGKADSALIYYKKAQKVDKDSFNTSLLLCNMGTSFLIKIQLDSAVSYYNKAFKFNPNYFVTNYQLGKLLFYKEQFDSARIYYKIASSINTNCFQCVSAIGGTFAKKGQFDSALIYMFKAIEMNPKYEWGYDNIGEVYFNKKMNDSALFYYEKAIQINPKFPNSYTHIAEVYQREKKYDSAIQYFDKVLQIEPKDVDVNYINLNYNIACLYSLIKNTNSSLLHLEKAIQLGYKDFGNIKKDTDLDNIKNTPEFIALMKKYFNDNPKD